MSAIVTVKQYIRATDNICTTTTGSHHLQKNDIVTWTANVLHRAALSDEAAGINSPVEGILRILL